MRQFIIAFAMALGLVGLWAVIVPLTAEPAPAQTLNSPAFSKALFLCRGPNGIDRSCAAALARALVVDPSADAADRTCHIDRKSLAALEHRD